MGGDRLGPPARVFDRPSERSGETCRGCRRPWAAGARAFAGSLQPAPRNVTSEKLDPIEVLSGANAVERSLATESRIFRH